MGLSGHLDLVCSLDERGKSIVSQQSFRAPMHLSKPWLEGDTLIVHLVNQTAGLLAGDIIETRIRIEPGARLVVTTPSASRAHRTDSREIFLKQFFQVEKKGFLEVFPELFIPQAGTTCRQHTRIDLENDSTLLYIDTLAPGRVASGESFQYRELDWRTDLFVNKGLLIRERSCLIPTAPNLLALRSIFQNAYYGTVYLATPHRIADNLKHLLDLQSSTLWIGLTSISSNLVALKLLAADSPTLRQAIVQIRDTIYQALGQIAPGLRKTG